MEYLALLSLFEDVKFNNFILNEKIKNLKEELTKLLSSDTVGSDDKLVIKEILNGLK